MSLTVVIGGTRSGKSAHAEALAAASGLSVRYVGTADAGDASMRARIDEHVARRPAAWTTVESPAALADALGDAGDTCVLLDGLGPWIATRMHRAGAFEHPARLPSLAADLLAEVDRAVRALARAGAAIVVAEQAGAGVLPLEATTRAWVDLLGEATQRTPPSKTRSATRARTPPWGPWPRCTAAIRARSCPPTAERRPCGSSAPRCGRLSPPASTRPSPRPRPPFTPTGSPSSAASATPSAASRWIPRTFRRAPTWS